MNIKKKYSIGRALDNDIVINHETVSRKHAEMTIDDDRIVLTDFNSKNGTYVIRNNNPVRVWIVEVKEDDTLVFGEVVIKVNELLRMASRVVNSGGMTPSEGISPHEIQSIPIYDPPAYKNSLDNEEVEYAGFWIRVGAYLIDIVIISIMQAMLLVLFYGTNFFVKESNKLFLGWMNFIISFILPIFYTLWFWFKKQATPGKMSLSLKIVNAKTGGIPSTGQFVGRYFAYILSTLPLCLGFVWVAFSKRKQGWHDILAGTVVIKLKKMYQ